MHNNNFNELSKHKKVEINSVVFQDNVIKAVFTTKQFNRKTMKPYWLTRSDYEKVIERMYI